MPPSLRGLCCRRCVKGVAMGHELSLLLTGSLACAGPFPSGPPILPGINGGDFDRLPQPFLRGSFGNVFGSRHFQGR